MRRDGKSFEFIGTITDITYRVEGEYLIPNIILDDETDDSSEEMIGRYGLMRENFLREHQHGTCTAMLLMEKLTAHLREIDRQAEEVVLREICINKRKSNIWGLSQSLCKPPD